MASYNGEGPDDDYMELSNEEIDTLIRKNFEFIKNNLRVYDLITGPHLFDPVIPNNVLEELKLKDPELKIKHAHIFLEEYLKSKYIGKGKILKDALLMRGPDSGDALSSDHRLIWTALCSKTSGIDLVAHSHDQKLIQALQGEIIESIDCEEVWLSDCLGRGLITKKEFEEIRSFRGRSGTDRGNVMLLECITRTYQFLQKFLELLWNRGLRRLVQRIDKVQYEKFLAHDTDGGSDGRPMRHHTEYMSGPVEDDECTCQNEPNADQNHDLYSSEKQLNIPLDNLNDGPIASRTRSKTKEFCFRMSKKEYCCYNEGNSTRVNQYDSTSLSAPEMMNPSTTDESRNLPTGSNDRRLRNSDRGYHSLDDEHSRTEVPGRRTRQFGFQSSNTIAYTQKAYTIPVFNEKEENIPEASKASRSKHEDVKKQTKTSEETPTINKTSQELKKLEKAQEGRNTISRTHTDQSENTGNFVPRQHSETLKPQSQTPANKLRTQAEKTSRSTSVHVERPSRTPEDLRNSFKKQTKTSEETPTINKTSQELKKLEKAQEDRNTISRTHTDQSENTGNFVPKPHSETLKPQSQTPPNKLRTQADQKPNKTPEHVESPSRAPEDLRNSFKKHEAMEKSTRSCDKLNAEGLSEIKAYPCPFCKKKKFVSDEKLQHHIKTNCTKCGAKGDPIRPRCQNCKKSFKDTETLNRHMVECSPTPLREVGSIRPIVDCSPRPLREVALREDDQANNRPTDVQRCSACNKRFADKKTLEKHKEKYGHL